MGQELRDIARRIFANKVTANEVNNYGFALLDELEELGLFPTYLDLDDRRLLSMPRDNKIIASQSEADQPPGFNIDLFGIKVSNQNNIYKINNLTILVDQTGLSVTPNVRTLENDGNSKKTEMVKGQETKAGWDDIGPVQEVIAEWLLDNGSTEVVNNLLAPSAKAQSKLPPLKLRRN